jgi:hypothetical protein
MQLLISCYPSIQPKKKRRRNLSLKSCENMAGARGCFNCGGCAWCFCVVAVVVSPSRALCADACTYSPLFFPPFLVVVYGAVLTGTATLFLQIAIHRPGTIKIVIENPCRVHRNCPVRVKNTSWTPGSKLPQGRHTHLVKKYPFSSDQMTSSRESLTRAFLVRLLISYNCESACVFSFTSLRSRVGFGDC